MMCVRTTSSDLTRAACNAVSLVIEQSGYKVHQVRRWFLFHQ